MGLEFLSRVRRASFWVGLVAALVVATYGQPLRGLAVGLGMLWSLANLTLLQTLIVALTGRDRGTLPATRRAIAAIGGTLLLFVGGWLLLRRFPAMLLMAGFWIPFAVLLLKAVSRLLIPSRAWSRDRKSVV